MHVHKNFQQAIKNGPTLHAQLRSKPIAKGMAVARRVDLIRADLDTSQFTAAQHHVQKLRVKIMPARTHIVRTTGRTLRVKVLRILDAINART
jgi:hypothetical protein